MTTTAPGYAIANSAYIAALAECYVNAAPLSQDVAEGRTKGLWADVADGTITRADITGEGDRARNLRGRLVAAADRLEHPENEGRFPEYAHPTIDKIDLINWVDHCAGLLPHAVVHPEN